MNEDILTSRKIFESIEKFIVFIVSQLHFSFPIAIYAVW